MMRYARIINVSNLSQLATFRATLAISSDVYGTAEFLLLRNKSSIMPEQLLVEKQYKLTTKHNVIASVYRIRMALACGGNTHFNHVFAAPMFKKKLYKDVMEQSAIYTGTIYTVAYCG